MTTCPNCSHEFTVPAFQLWSGRCPQCDQAMTNSTRREDRLNSERPLATSEEFLEFLKYSDDLAAMRLRGDEASQLAALMLVGGFLWAFGIGFRLVEFEFGIFYAICVGVTFAAIFKWKLRSRCPRCRQKFGSPVTTGFNLTKFNVKLAPTSETCEHCGLKSLSQYDISRFLRSRGFAMEPQHDHAASGSPEESTDSQT